MNGVDSRYLPHILYALQKGVRLERTCCTRLGRCHSYRRKQVGFVRAAELIYANCPISSR